MGSWWWGRLWWPFPAIDFVSGRTSRNKPIVIINDGKTRGDEIATVTVAGSCGDILQHWLESKSVTLGKKKPDIPMPLPG